MCPAKVLHTVLQVAHIFEKVLAKGIHGLDGAGGGARRAIGTVGQLALVDGMAGHEGRNQDADEQNGKREDNQEVGVEADEGVDGQKGEGVRGAAPGEETDDARLELEDDADAGVEAVEIVEHGSAGEGWAGGLVGGEGVAWDGGVLDVAAGGHVLVGGGHDLLEEPGSESIVSWRACIHKRRRGVRTTYFSRSLSCMLACALKAERPRQPRCLPWSRLDSGDVLGVAVVSSPERADSSRAFRMSSTGGSMVVNELVAARFACFACLLVVVKCR